MKTLIFIILITLSFVCVGQNRDSIYRHSIIGTKAETVQKQVDSIKKGKTYLTAGRVADFGNYIAAGGYNGYTGSTYTFKKAEYIIMLDQIKVTDTIWIQSGKKKIGVPSWKLLALLGYADDAEKFCPVCGKDFLWNTSSLRNKNGYIWKQYNCENCGYHEIHYYTKSEN